MVRERNTVNSKPPACTVRHKYFKKPRWGMKLNGGMMSSTPKDLDLILSLTELNDVY